MKTLIFFTSEFPFGNGETFIENEFPFLQNAFDNIFIVTNNVTAKYARPVPFNINGSIIRIPYEASLLFKIRSVLNWFNPVIKGEKKFIRHSLQISLTRKILSILFGTYGKAIEMDGWLNEFIAENKIETDSLYLYSYWMNDMTAGIAYFKYHHPEVKAFCRAHGWDVYFERHQPPYLPLRNFILENVDCCFCISENGRNYLQNLVRPLVADKHLKLSRLGVFNPAAIRNAGNTGQLTIVSCSNIIPLKRISLIIESLLMVHNIEVDWKHFGSGPLENEMKQLAKAKLTVMPNIKYHFAGQISNKELMNYYAANPVDVFINLSETEGLPVSIMEVGSFGIPVIATDVGGVSEIIQHEQNGLLLKANCSPSEVSKAIETFYNYTDQVKTVMRNNAYANWEKYFDASKNYAAFINMVGSL